jgi:hypothetical protein
MVDFCVPVLYENIRLPSRSSQSTEDCSASRSVVVRKSAMVLLNCSTCAFVLGWYGVVVLCSILRRFHMALLSLLQNSLPWSVTTSRGIPRCTIQWSQSARDTDSAVLSGRAATAAYLVKASVMTMMYFLEASAARRGPNRSACMRWLG